MRLAVPCSRVRKRIAVACGRVRMSLAFLKGDSKDINFVEDFLVEILYVLQICLDILHFHLDGRHSHVKVHVTSFGVTAGFGVCTCGCAKGAKLGETMLVDEFAGWLKFCAD